MAETREELEVKAKMVKELQERAIVERCKYDPLLWLTQYTATEDPHYMEKTGEQRTPVKPFPKKDFFAAVASYMYSSDRIMIPKSREMMTSWLTLGLATHLCQFWPATLCCVMTQSERKVTGIVAYAQCLHRHQPKWLRDRYPLTPDSYQSKSTIGWQGRGKLIGLPSGPDQVRLYHPTWTIFDEAAFIDDFQAAYEAAQQCSRKIIGVSSAQPSTFGEWCERPIGEVVDMNVDVWELYRKSAKDYFDRMSGNCDTTDPEISASVVKQ